MANDSYSALSDPTRRRILSALRGGSRPVGELVEELDVSQPTVSKHLKVLRDTGLVATRAEGQKRYYSLEPQPLRDVAAWLEELVDAPEEPAETVQDEPETVETSDEIPAAEEEPRNLPWFTVEQAEEDHAQETVEADSVGTAESETTELATSEPAASEPGTSETAEPEPQIAEEPVFDVISDETLESEHGNLQDLLDDPEVSNVSTLPDAVALEAEVEVTGVSVGANTDVLSAESSADSDEFEESNSMKPEFGIPPARSGGAHRRQSGLLSTLTGFRRRGRNSRR